MQKKIASLRMTVALNHPEDNDYNKFELLYDTHAPKMLGFILNYTITKEIAEEYLIKVFLKVWDNIKTFEENVEAKILVIMLSICKPIYQKSNTKTNE